MYNVRSSQNTTVFNMVHGLIITINYTFRPLYWPSSGLHYVFNLLSDYTICMGWPGGGETRYRL
jgi:hypothetical protein